MKRSVPSSAISFFITLWNYRNSNHQKRKPIISVHGVWWWVRILVQGCLDRGLRRRKIKPAVPDDKERVQAGLKADYRGRIRYSEHQYRREAHQGSAMGHCRSGKVNKLKLITEGPSGRWKCSVFFFLYAFCESIDSVSRNSLLQIVFLKLVGSGFHSVSRKEQARGDCRFFFLNRVEVQLLDLFFRGVCQK